MATLQRLSSGGDAANTTIRLRRRITTLGSDTANDLHITGDDIAGQHATITCRGAHFTIRPAAKKASVRVNTKRVRRKRVLEHGDQIAIGDTQFEFRILDDASTTDQVDPDIQRRLDGLERIHRLSVELLKAGKLDELVDTIIDAAIELTAADKGFLVLSENDSWSVRVARNVGPQRLDEQHGKLSDSVLQHVLETRSPLIVADARQDDDFREAQSVIELELCSVLCVPLLNRGELLGAIYVGNDRVADLFDELDLELLSIFSAELSLVIANAILVDELRSDKQSLEQRLRNRRFGSLIGASEAMEPVFYAIERVAPTNVTVLITGETGTGKELVASEIHHRSDRRDAPFITINCGAIPETLLESELFGHEKGAFTGAAERRDGKFQAAHRGTLFLDEIGELPLDLQVKLLRAIQEHTVTRVGANEQENVDIRILAATNRDLKAQIDQGAFREDLYYRLNVIEISLPPLRSRGRDIILIAEYLIDQICDEFELPHRKLSPAASRAMKKFDWPGNIRELQNRLKKALILSDNSTISAADLGLPSDTLPEVRPLAQAKEEFAIQYVLEVLEQNDGNRSQTARDLEIDPRTVFRYLDKVSENGEP